MLRIDLAEIQTKRVKFGKTSHADRKWYVILWYIVHFIWRNKFHYIQNLSCYRTKHL